MLTYEEFDSGIALQYMLFADGVYISNALGNAAYILTLRNRLAKQHDVFLDLLVAFEVETLL